MSKYKMTFNQYEKCKKMTKNEFSRWIKSFAENMYQQGYDKACEDVPEGAVVIDTTDTMLIDLTEENIKSILLSVSGVGEKLCDKIIEKIYEKCDGYVKEGIKNKE